MWLFELLQVTSTQAFWDWLGSGELTFGGVDFLQNRRRVKWGIERFDGQRSSRRQAGSRGTSKECPPG